EILHDPVVQVGGDPPPLVGRCLERVHEQPLALELRPLQLAGEPPGERDLDEPEQKQAAEQGDRERTPDPPAAGHECTGALIRLEQKRRTVRRPDACVDLVQRAELPLESILGSAQIAQIGLGVALPERLHLVAAELVACADQPRLVRVHDAPAGVPDLHAHHSLVEDPLLDDPVDPLPALRVARERTSTERRLDDALPGEGGVLARVPQRVSPAEVADHEECPDEEDRDGDQARHDELGHRPGDGGRAGVRRRVGVPAPDRRRLAHPAETYTTGAGVRMPGATSRGRTTNVPWRFGPTVRQGGSRPRSRRKDVMGTTKITVAIISLLAALGIASAASAKGGGPSVSGTCTAASASTLKAKSDDGRLEVEFEVDSNVVRQAWRVVLADNGSTFLKKTLKTKGPSGSFTARARPRDRAGA